MLAFGRDHYRWSVQQKSWVRSRPKKVDLQKWEETLDLTRAHLTSLGTLSCPYLISCPVQESLT